MSETKPKNVVNRNSLSGKQKFALYKVLEEWAKELQETRPLYRDVAARAATALGFAVSPGNVRGAAEDMGIAWRAKAPGGGCSLSKANLYRRMTAAEKQVAALRSAIRYLCERIAEEPPTEIDDNNWPETPRREKKS